MPLKQTMLTKTIAMMTRNIDEAVELLRDPNLVWGADFNSIRYQLADLLIVSAAQSDVMQTLADSLAKRLISPYAAEVSYDPNLEKRDA
jgi:hypothetical protein